MRLFPGFQHEGHGKATASDRDVERAFKTQHDLAQRHRPKVARQLLRRARLAIKVENEVVAGANVLADFVDDEDYVFFAGMLSNNVDHLSNTVFFEANYLASFG